MSKLSDIFKKLLDGGRFTEWADDIIKRVSNNYTDDAVRAAAKSKDALVGVHRTFSSKLADAADLGGFPAMSVGIYNPAKNRISKELGDRFGDVTLLMNADKIRPESGSAFVGNRDIWSPRVYERAVPTLNSDDEIARLLKRRPSLTKRGITVDDVKHVARHFTPSQDAVPEQILSDLNDIYQKFNPGGIVKDNFVSKTATPALINNPYTGYKKLNDFVENLKWIGTSKNGITLNGEVVPRNVVNVNKSSYSDGKGGLLNVIGGGKDIKNGDKAHWLGTAKRFTNTDDMYKSRNLLTTRDDYGVTRSLLGGARGRVLAGQPELSKYGSRTFFELGKDDFASADNLLKRAIASGDPAEIQRFVPGVKSSDIADLRQAYLNAPTAYFESKQLEPIYGTDIAEAFVPKTPGYADRYGYDTPLSAEETAARLKRMGVNKITQYDTFDELDNLLADRARARNRALPYILGLGGVSALPAFLSGYNNQSEV